GLEVKMGPKILILDDQAMYTRALVRSLRAGYEVVAAMSLEEAKERVTEDVRAALVDIRLREEDPGNREGLEFVRWLKKNHQEIPAIVMSALDDSSLPSEAAVAGAIVFLQKP